MCFLCRTEGEADKPGEDANHTKNLVPRVVLMQKKKSVGKADNRSASTDGTDNSNHRIRVTERQHIDIIRDNQKDGNEEDDG